jgi:hypothetical protein
MTVDPSTSWATERGDALDSLVTPMQAEWLCDMSGTFRLRPLPPVSAAAALVKWIIDSGDEGVLIDRVVTADRQNMFNQAVVSSEAIGGSQVTTKTYELKQSEDPVLYWGGPYGRIPRFYTGQNVRTSIAAQALAQTLVTDAKSALNSVSVQCVVNPKLQLGDVVRIFDGRTYLDALYFVQQIDLPLEPQSPMRLTCYASLARTTAGIVANRRRLPEGSTWVGVTPR